MSSFIELGVDKGYLKGLQELGINTPTEIQIKTIPCLLESRTDFIGLAQTGTGKTAAFGIPILKGIDPDKPVIQALILSPTRELVQQIKKQLFKFTKYIDDKIFIEAVYGGEKIEKQISNLKRPTHVVVATPGRLIDLIERGEVDLQNIRTLVLDEADEMLSMGFKLELNRILKYTGGARNTWLFSATMPDEIQFIIKKYMSPKAIRVEVNKNSMVNENIIHRYILTSVKGKFDALVQLLEGRREERGIIFCRTKAGTQNLCKRLQEEGFSADALEGDMQQRDRDKVMRAFKNKSLQLLVSTDVSARGIDVQNLAFVIHHQIPEKMEYYTHRSGRTARAGNTGYSFVLIIPSEMENLRQIENKLGIQIKDIKL